MYPFKCHPLEANLGTLHGGTTPCSQDSPGAYSLWILVYINHDERIKELVEDVETSERKEKMKSNTDYLPFFGAFQSNRCTVSELKSDMMREMSTIAFTRHNTCMYIYV
jgi:hypothetical protein